MPFDFAAGKPAFGKDVSFKFPQVGGLAKNAEPDPLADVEYTGDLQADTTAELTEMQKAYRERAAKEADRFQAATDTTYWFAVVFPTSEDKNRFLNEFGLNARGDDQYLDGRKVADILRQRA